MIEKYIFKREDNSGITLEIETTERKHTLKNIGAFDTERNDLVVSAFDLEYALDCFNAIVMQQQPKGETLA